MTLPGDRIPRLLPVDPDDGHPNHLDMSIAA